MFDRQLGSGNAGRFAAIAVCHVGLEELPIPAKSSRRSSGEAIAQRPG
jgi:hypothetical protein